MLGGQGVRYLWTKLRAAEGRHHRRALLHGAATGSSQNTAPLRQLRPQRPEGLRRRIRRADVRRGEAGQPQQLGSARSPRPRSSPVWSATPTWCRWRLTRRCFAHVDAWQWTPNLIWFDNLRSYGTPNYYVQKMYATNLGTRVLPVDANGSGKNATGRALHQRVNRREEARS